MLHRFYIHYIS